MAINKNMIKQRLMFMKEYLGHLERLSAMPREEFIGTDYAAAAESYLRRILEAMFDIGRHIMAKSGSFELAQEYKSIAKGLKDYKVVDEKLGDRMVKIAGYRNRMVHLYSLITDEEIYYIVTNELGDIHSFIRQVYVYLEHPEKDQ